MFARRHRKGNQLLLVLLAWVTILAGSVLLIDMRLRPLIKKVAGNQARVYATKAINNSIAAAMLGSELRPSTDLIHISYDDTGKVTAVQTDTGTLNLLAAEITDEVSRRISQLQEQSIQIPVGTLLGHQLVSGRGPRILFKIIPVGFVETKLVQRFESAGINQTRHQIILEITSNITAVLPGYSTYSSATASVTLADTVIVGVSPQSYTKVITGDTSGMDLAGLIEDYGANNQ